ncbi:lipase secretion chaperone, partial [Acinetobacter baumannii]
AELPPEQRADRAHAVAHLGAAVQTQDFEARGVDDRTRYQLRSATYGTDAAQALARLDHEERAWNQKLDDYAAAKAQAHDPSQM